MKRRFNFAALPLMVFSLLNPGGAVPAMANGGVNATYLYSLSNLTGKIPYSWVRNVIDREHDEIVIIDGGSISIFNRSGMEIYTFGEDLAIGVFKDVAFGRGGDLLLLTHQGDAWSVTRCNYRGEPQSRIEIRNLPVEFGKIFPSRIFSRDGKLYLADLTAKMVVVTDEKGIFLEGYDLAPLLRGFEDKPNAENNIFGFTVDREGNLFFTVPTLFKVFRFSPDRELSSFGEPGSIPGKFNIISGIATDARGNIYVADSLRCAVMVFDKEFRFQTQFSQRGLDPGSLIAPRELAVDGNGRVYVSQARRRGISVFQVTFD